MGAILSARERRVALLVTRGLSNKKIATELGISAGTVKLHVHRILRKLNVERRQGIGLVVERAALQQIADYPVNPNAMAHAIEVMKSLAQAALQGGMRWQQ